MPKINMVLEEQLTDMRSHEMAFLLRIENKGPKTIHVKSVNPQFPDGVTLKEVKDNARLTAHTDHTKLAKELSLLLSDFVLARSAKFRAELIKEYKQAVDEVLSGANWVPKLYWNLLSKKIWKIQEQIREKSESMTFAISNVRDADMALSTFMKDEDENSFPMQLFKSKLEQLKELESKLGDVENQVIADVEPESLYFATYILTFKRNYFTTSRFYFSVEGHFEEVETKASYVTSVTQSVPITPKPFFLTAVAVLSSLLGVCLNFSMNEGSTLHYPDYFDGMGHNLVSGPGVSAAILALLIFNILEHTPLGKNIKLGINWRSALMTGILCGMFSDRILNSLQVLVGFKDIT